MQNKSRAAANDKSYHKSERSADVAALDDLRGIAIRLYHLADAFGKTGNQSMKIVLEEQSSTIRRAIETLVTVQKCDCK